MPVRGVFGFSSAAGVAVLRAAGSVRGDDLRAEEELREVVDLPPVKKATIFSQSESFLGARLSERRGRELEVLLLLLEERFRLPPRRDRRRPPRERRGASVV